MIHVAFYRDQNALYRGFEVKGHADFSDSGKDIVCAAVSALVINAVNSIESLTEDAVIAEAKDGYVRLKFISIPGTISVALMDSLELGLKSIQTDHGDYIQICYKEVYRSTR